MKRTQLKQTPFKRKEGVYSSFTKPRKQMKSKPKKRSKICQHAKNVQACTLQLSSMFGKSCGGDIVLCHNPFDSHITGKGMGIKGDDKYGAYGCAVCHDILDGRDNVGIGCREVIRVFYYKAQRVSQGIMREAGFLDKKE